MKIKESDLPRGWCNTSLEKIAIWGSGGTPSRNIERYFQGAIPWVKTGELGAMYIRETSERITDEAVKNSSAKIFPKGAVGIAMYGATIGKLSIWGIDASTNQACAVGIPTEAIGNEFLYYFLLAEKRNFIKAGKGGAQPNISQGIIKEWPINLPPLSEQHRIVAKIDELFSDLDKGVENLKTARAQLKVYRQALLKHAFEGKLTAQWREDNKDKLETAEALLKRIQRERTTRYKQLVAEWESAGQSPSKPKAPKPMSPLAAGELRELSELPKGWGWFKLAALSDISGGLTKNQKRNTLPIRRPFLRVGNVYANRLELGDMHDTGISETEIERVTLVKGDLLIVEGNGSVDQIGRVAIWNGSIEGCVHQNHLIKARPQNLVRSEFLLYFLMSELGRKFIVRAASSTSGLHTLSISKVESLFVPLCAVEEQSILLSELSSKLSLADQLDQTITTALQQAEALRQSILKKAFSGQLVPQDPHDEPAAALLARIKADRTTIEKSVTSARNARKPRKPAMDNA